MSDAIPQTVSERQITTIDGGADNGPELRHEPAERRHDRRRSRSGDRLTGLADRDAFARAVDQADRDRDRLLVAVLTVDGLAEINQLCGYDVGDSLLAALGRVLADRVSVDLTAGRVGGSHLALLQTPAPPRNSTDLLGPIVDDLDRALGRWLDDRAALGTPCPIVPRARVGVAAGHGGATWTDAETALAVAEAANDPLEATQAGALAIARVWAGRHEEAWPLFDRTRELARAEDHTFAGVAAMIYSAIAALESGDPNRARALADEALAFADANQFENLAHLGLAYSIAARTGSEDGGGDERAEAARKGVALARRSPALISLAYALTTAGDVLCELGTDDGPEAVTEARALIDRCPDPGIAGRYLDRVEARHGLMAAPRAVTGLIEELTDRELAVLRFLPSPLSQREIANELFVSLNTVKTHCRAIYRKLGAGDRRAAVQAARDLGLL